MDELVKILHDGHFSCVIRKGEEIRTYTRRGVTDLLDVLEYTLSFLHGSQVADKVVGRGAAALMILGQIAEVHADVISEGAKDLLLQANICTTYETCVSHIINRAGTGQCPIEILCAPYTRPEDMLPKIQEFISNMKSQKIGPALSKH